MKTVKLLKGNDDQFFTYMLDYQLSKKYNVIYTNNVEEDSSDPNEVKHIAESLPILHRYVSKGEFPTFNDKRIIRSFYRLKRDLWILPEGKEEKYLKRYIHLLMSPNPPNPKHAIGMSIGMTEEQVKDDVCGVIYRKVIYDILLDLHKGK